MARLLLILFVTAPACYAPGYQDCRVRCGDGESCAQGLQCIDGWCQSGSSVCGPDLSATSDAGATDLATPDLWGVRCNAALVCDDFESPTISLGKWSRRRYPSSSAISFDTTRAHRGSGAAHFSVESPAPDAGGAAGAAAIYDPMVLMRVPAGGTTAWIRFWYWAPPHVAAPTIVHAHNGPAFQGVSIALNGAQLVLDHSYVGAQITRAVPPYSQWVCMVLRIDYKMPVHTDDGSEVLEPQMSKGRNSTVGPAPGIPDDLQEVALGPEFGANYGAYEMWIDDVIIDDKPITCDD